MLNVKEMLMRKKMAVGLALTAFGIGACVSSPKINPRTVASNDSDVKKIADQMLLRASTQKNALDFSSPPWRARSLDDSFLKSVATSSNLKLIEGQLLTDNDAAFDKKLELINSAKESIRMVYFIFSEDDSSSVINQALIEKAKQGVKIDLLVDFVTNFKNIDLFQMLESEGNENLTVHFYNVPPGQMLQAANYIVLPCPTNKPQTSTECLAAKKTVMDKMSNKQNPTAFAKLLMTGIYGRSNTALKVAMGYGAEIDPKNYKHLVSSIIENKEEMFDFVQTVGDAIIDDSLIAKIKVSLAMATYGELLTPLINEIAGRISGAFTDNSETGALWDHLSDYTHHKLLAIDQEQIILGGRNIEDSYHMKYRVGLKGKYIFEDTDFWGKTRKGGTSAIERSFDKLVQSSMARTLKQIKPYFSSDFIKNVSGNLQAPGATELAVGYCLKQSSAELGNCILDALQNMPGFKSEASRIEVRKQAMEESIQRFNNQYKNTSRNVFTKLSSKDLSDSELYYLENTNFEDKTTKRILGSKVGDEIRYNKNIQAVWYRGLENACKVSRETRKEVRVIFHTAYLIMPSGMIHKIAQMMNNELGDCSGIRLQFITNSAFTTDLGPINVLARYQLGALFDYYQTMINYKTDFEKEGLSYKQFFPKIEYYELEPHENIANSLHTKTTLIGEDMIVGSANADIRSYYMDSNNALLIRNATEMNAKYRAEIDKQIQTGKLKDKMNNYIGKSFESLRAENENDLNLKAKRWKQEKRLTPQRVKYILDTLDKAGAEIYDVTKRLLVFRGEFEHARAIMDGTQGTDKLNSELNDKANKFDAKYKVF